VFSYAKLIKFGPAINIIKEYLSFADSSKSFGTKFEVRKPFC